MKTILSELIIFENVLLENKDIARVNEVIHTVKNPGTTTLPEQLQLNDLQPTTSTYQPRPIPSLSLKPATVQTCSPPTNQF